MRFNRPGCDHRRTLGRDLAGGEAEVRADYAFLQEHGETYFLASMAALLARIVREQGRDQEALDLSVAAEEAAAEHDLDAQVRWRAVRAPILARLGKFNDAKELAESALTIARKTGLPILQADALFDLAVTRLLSDEIDGASAALRRRVRCIAVRATAHRSNISSGGRANIWRNEKARQGRAFILRRNGLPGEEAVFLLDDDDLCDALERWVRLNFGVTGLQHPAVIDAAIDSLSGSALEHTEERPPTSRPSAL